MAESKFRLKLNIGTKIFGGFLILIFLFAVIASIIFGTINNINGTVKLSSQEVNPTRDAINEWITIVHRTRMLITNWVFLQANNDDKDALRYIINNQYPAVKKRLEGLTKNHADTAQTKAIQVGFGKYESLIEGAKENVITKLVTFDDYEDGFSKVLAESYIDERVIPDSNEIIELLTSIQEKQNGLTAKAENQLVESASNLQTMTLIFGIAIVALGLLFAFLLMRNITRPINYIRDVVVKMGRGELVDDKNTKFNKDEIGEMAKAMDQLVTGLKGTTLFAKNIGEGKYDSQFAPLSSNDVLGNALLEMRDNLAKVAEDDKRRNWASEGLAKFAEILRENTSEVSKLSDTVISSLVKYLNANQGALYLIDDTDATEKTMSMTACYAWNKKKYMGHQVYYGEGLVGQCWQEGDVIFLTDVPDNYIKISSGLGDANPTCILIVPLKVNDQIFGVVEIASFNVIKDFEIDFVRKIAESLGSTISSVKVNAKTQRLLEESQELTEQMRAQEEEMRQNMEELQATQEEMERSQFESEVTMNAINSAVSVCEFGVDGLFQKANQNYLNLLGYRAQELGGELVKTLFHRDDRNYMDFRNFMSQLANGRQWSGVVKHSTRTGETITMWASFCPVKNKSGEVARIMEFAVELGKA